LDDFSLIFSKFPQKRGQKITDDGIESMNEPRKGNPRKVKAKKRPTQGHPKASIIPIYHIIVSRYVDF
jgi:hypothetical protein